MNPKLDLFVDIIAWVAIVVSLLEIIIKVQATWSYQFGRGRIQRIQDHIIGVKRTWPIERASVILIVAAAWVIATW